MERNLELHNGKKYNPITREKIEGCLDDELDMIFGPWCPKEANSSLLVVSSEILKKCMPEKYNEYLIDYMERNKIVNIDGKYFEEVDE